MAGTGTHRLALLAACLACGAATTLPPVPPPVPPTVLPTAQDAAARPTIQVRINGQGPFAFVVDTGADRTVISRELAARLHLPPGDPVRLHHTAGVETVDTVELGDLSFGDQVVHGVEAPALAQADLGALGMLGIDSLRDQQIVLDFSDSTFTAHPSAANEPDPAGTIVVLGKRRFGQLVLVDARADGVPILVILDTGAQNTLGNPALQTLMAGVQQAKPDSDIISVAGGHSPARLKSIDDVTLNDLRLENVPIAYADLEIFHHFGLQNRPAMLLGMDILRLFRSVSVDFPRHQAGFLPR
jgi:predicted aspartyl protease